MQLLVLPMPIVIHFPSRLYRTSRITWHWSRCFQEADLLSMTTPITKANYQIKNVDDIPKIVHEAFYIANTGRKGPVVIDFPKDMGVLKHPYL